MPNREHKWVTDGLGGGHRGEYNYTCSVCGARDWIAGYSTVDQLGDGKPCPGPSAEDSIRQLTDAQIEAQGVGCVQVKDGQVFTFTTLILRHLLEQSIPTGRAVVFVKHGAVS